MKLNILVALIALLSLNACQKDSGPVPEDWYLLPENGQAQNPGSLDQLGKIFDQFLRFILPLWNRSRPLRSALTMAQENPSIGYRGIWRFFE